MKKIFYSTLVFILSILLSATGFAQGIYQLWGMTTQGGTDDIGVVFRADGEGNNLKSMHSFTKTNPGANPMYNQLTEYNGKFYSMTSAGGANNLGVIFEWDPVTNSYIKKYDFETVNGSKPFGSLVLLNDKFYGMTNAGGINDMGVVFEWNPANNEYLKKYDFDGATGSNPFGSLLSSGGKFYGMTYSGGSNNQGVIFEWNPVGDTFLKKYDFNGEFGSNPYGDLVFQNGKFYGMTSSGGINERGVIFEWDPSANYTMKFEFGSGFRLGYKPYGSLAFANGKFYGMTSQGGNELKGDIFEWDPVTNIYTKRFDFGSTSYAIGIRPYGNLLFKDGKFFGMAYREGGGRYSHGLIFEWDPITNGYSRKYVYEENSTDDDTYNGANPQGSLVLSSGKIYGMTSFGGSGRSGVIFEWDPAGPGTYTKKINFKDPVNGESPNSLAYQDGHLYGITSAGGFDGLGVIFDFDFAANKFVTKHVLRGASGNSRHPIGNMAFCNGKFYGMSFYYTEIGHRHRHIFEWDPVSNAYQYFPVPLSTNPNVNLVESGGKLYGIDAGIFEWDPASKLFTMLYQFLDANEGLVPNWKLVDSAGKLFGTTASGGINNAGVIYEWDIAAKVYSKRHDFNIVNGATPIGNLAQHDGEFYGLTSKGGSNNQGVIFQWDPVGSAYTKKYDIDEATDGKPNGDLLFNNGKMYGMDSSGGVNNYGGIFEWDPVANLFSVKSAFNGIDGRNPVSKNKLTVVPAMAARGVPNNCVTYPPVTIDNNSTNNWVPIFDNNGFAIAEIKANGNNLGIVNTSLYVHDKPIREDGDRRLYLDRNITITPQFQPTTPVDIRLYISGSEFTTIKNASNSIGSPSGIATINDLGIFKNDDACESNLIKKASRVVTTGTKWETDYVLSATVTTFSTFYFANKANAVLPLTLLEFDGRLQNNNALLNWKTDNEINTAEFKIERSFDGNQYKAIGTVAAANRAGIHNYNFTDPAINTSGVKIVYYRLKQYDIDGQFIYSNVVTLSIDNENTIVRLYPNPVNNEFKLSISSPLRDDVKLKIMDASGRTINLQTKQVVTGSNSFTIDLTKMATGVYYLSIQGNAINKWMQFVKQ
ncbi:MAG: choice-of-anchor tandem repeat GloVer-containing protein [Chitinophagaceae bacterium]